MSHLHRGHSISPEESLLPAGHSWRRLPWIGLALGVLGTAGAWLLAGSDHRQFYFSWLVAFMFFLSIALGGLFFVLAHFVTKAGWSVVVRRTAEHVMSTLPLFLLLFIPIAAGMHDLFHWTHEEVVAGDHILEGKAPYLNVQFFLIRAAVYFLFWIVLSVWFSRQSQRQDVTGDHAITRQLQAVSAPGIFAFALTSSFAAIDWMMSLDPHWYSTIYGVYYFSGTLVGIYAFMIVVLTAMRRAGLLRGIVTVEHFHDLGKLLFAFTVFWTYIAFCQFFVIWYGNMPEETLWYIDRLEGSWEQVTIFLAVGHFAIPFFFLMSHKIKRKAPLLLIGAVWMLLLKSDGTVKSHQKISDTEGGFTGGLDDDDWFGVAGVASLGDLDGDGRGDLAVGAPHDDDGGANRGAVWILFLDGAPGECPWDLNNDDAVGTPDLIVLLGSWGDPYGARDLIELLGNWGRCP